MRAPSIAQRRAAPAALLALLLAAPLLALACRSTPPPSPFVEDELVVLSDFDHPPFAYVGEQGQARGLEVELVEELARRLGRTLVWRRHPFVELLPRLEDGEGHVVAASIGITPERAQRVHFSRPYFVTDLVAVARVGEGEPGTLGELSGRVVSAAPGTSAAYALRHVLPKAQRALADAEHELVDRLLRGDVDAIVLDLPDAQRLLELGLPVRILTPRLDRERYALALSPLRPLLRQEVDAALLELEREGELARLVEAWGLEASAR